MTNATDRRSFGAQFYRNHRRPVDLLIRDLSLLRYIGSVCWTWLWTGSRVRRRWRRAAANEGPVQVDRLFE